MLDGVVFDMDGTLLDTEEEAIVTWLWVGEQLGVPIDRALMLSVVGYNSRDTEAVFRRALGADFDFEGARRLRREEGARRLEKYGVTAKPGALGLVRQLKEEWGLKLAVASSTRREGVLRSLEKARMLPFIDAVVGGDEVSRGKPDPMIYQEALSRLGLPAGRCAAVEDSPVGAESAWRAGLRVLLCPDLIAPDGRTLARITARVDSLEGAAAVLETFE